MTKQRRKLIFCWPYIEWGGAQIYFLGIMKLARDDWDIVVALPERSKPDILRFLNDLGIRYEFIDACSDAGPAPTLRRKLQRHRQRIHDQIVMWRYLRKFDLKQAVLHIEVAPWQDWIFLTLLSARGANVFSTMHNFLPKYALWREMIWRARLQFVSRLPRFRIFASNHDTRNKLRGWVSERFWERIPVTYTTVNPPEIDAVLATPFDRDGEREQIGIPKDNYVVLCVGQFIDRKGRWVFLEAAKKVLTTRQDITFVWVTPNLPEGDDKARVDEYKLGDSLKLVLSETVGTTRDQVLSFFRIADVFALPSLVEGLPIALLEAMALGVPSISTNVYAIPEAVHDRETGLLIPAGDSDALASAIIQLIDDPDLRGKLAKAGRKYVMSTFDERVASRTAISAYEECFADRH